MRWRMDEEIGSGAYQSKSSNPFDKIDSQIIYDDDEMIGARKSQIKLKILFNFHIHPCITSSSLSF